MNSTKRYLAIIVIGLAAVAAPISSVAANPEDGMESMVQTARNKADHEAIAAQYDAQEKNLLAQAEQHERMGKLYRGMELGGGKGPKLAGHCDALAASFRSAAGQNQELARLHRDLAAQATE